MKINQAKTAIECYHSLPEEHFSREEKQALNWLTAPRSISSLCRLTGIEKSSMSRVLNSLHHKKGKISVAYVNKCPITGKTVQFYQVKQPQQTLF